jgi:hypothetical protein
VRRGHLPYGAPTAASATRGRDFPKNQRFISQCISAERHLALDSD